MTEQLNTNTIGDYILKEMDRMLYEHIPFKTISQNINKVLSQQNIDYSISTEDVEKYAMEHFFNEARENLTIEDTQEIPVKEILEEEKKTEKKPKAKRKRKEDIVDVRELPESKIRAFFLKILDVLQPKHLLIYSFVFFVIVFLLNIYYWKNSFHNSFAWALFYGALSYVLFLPLLSFALACLVIVVQEITLGIYKLIEIFQK